MPLNELLIALHAWGNKEDREVLNSQFIAYHAMIGSHLDPKKIPSFEKFVNKDQKAIKTASNELKSVFRQEYQDYLKQIGK